ncbi:MAG: hypothetical protein M1608_14565 [Candidatus Omnitrophica bacterium]|nr:hypothetical protein [Candidatus Omnitrophota bacterium]
MNLRSCKESCLLGMLLSLFPAVDHAAAQVYPDFAWAAGVNARGSIVYGAALAIDSVGNSYVCGNFNGDVSFGGIILTNKGFFLAKYDPRGRLIWVKQDRNFGAERNRSAVAADAQGNVYVTGSIFANAGAWGDLLLAKYDSDGDLIWLRQTGSDVVDYGSGVAVDKTGNVCVTGVFHLTVLGPLGDPVTDPALQKIFIAKYNAQGDMLWEKKIVGKGDSLNLGKGIGMDGEGNVYLTGRFVDTNLFGPNMVSGYGSFLAKYDGAGNLLWATNASKGMVEGIAVSDQGDSCLVGSSREGILTFGNQTLMNPSHNILGFVVKYDRNGNALWAKSISVSPSGPDYSTAVNPMRIAVDVSGNGYLTGNFSNIAIFGTHQIAIENDTFGYVYPPDAFIAKCDGNGNFLWARNIGRGSKEGIGVAIDAEGSAYLTGNFGGELTLGKTILESYGPSFFVTQLPALYLTALDRPVRFGLAAESGRECVIEYSRDLTRWFGLVTNTMPASGFLEFNHGIISVPDQLFYRARSVSP